MHSIIENYTPYIYVILEFVHKLFDVIFLSVFSMYYSNLKINQLGFKIINNFIRRLLNSMGD